MTEERKQELNTYAKEYYWNHHDILRAKAQQMAKEAKASKQLNRSWSVMLEEWKNGLQNRLKDNDIPGWLRFAIMKQIELIDEKERTLQEDR